MGWIVWWTREDLFTEEKDPENVESSDVFCETLDDVFKAIREVALLLPLEPSFPKEARGEALNLLDRVKADSPKFGLDEDDTRTFEFRTGNFMVGIDDHPLPFEIYKNIKGAEGD
jgi:hypothetical protein